MNAVPATATPPLLDLLGARWRVEVPVTSVAWSGRGAFAGFALRDGSLALAPAAWDGAPMLRRRDRGGTEIVPGTAAAPPVARVPVHQGACLAVAADPNAGFLTVGEDGQVARVLADGDVRVLARAHGPVTSVAAGQGGWRAFATGREVHRLGGSAARIEVGGVVASLALEPAHTRLAIGHAGGVTVWAGGDAPHVLAAPGIQSGLAWSGDSKWLASCTTEGVLCAWRLPDPPRAMLKTDAPVHSLGTLGNGFVTGAGGRLLSWNPGDGDTEPQTCGAANQTSVTRVAGHPRRPTVAAGYANGAVALCQPNDASLLILRGAGDGAVSALVFSPLGDHLAIGTEGGEIAVLALPDVLFRDGASP